MKLSVIHKLRKFNQHNRAHLRQVTNEAIDANNQLRLVKARCQYLQQQLDRILYVDLSYDIIRPVLRLELKIKQKTFERTPTLIIGMILHHIAHELNSLRR